MAFSQDAGGFKDQKGKSFELQTPKLDCSNPKLNEYVMTQCLMSLAPTLKWSCLNIGCNFLCPKPAMFSFSHFAIEAETTQL